MKPEFGTIKEISYKNFIFQIQGKKKKKSQAGIIYWELLRRNIWTPISEVLSQFISESN